MTLLLLCTSCAVRAEVSQVLGQHMTINLRTREVEGGRDTNRHRLHPPLVNKHAKERRGENTYLHVNMNRSSRS